MAVKTQLVFAFVIVLMTMRKLGVVRGIPTTVGGLFVSNVPSTFVVMTSWLVRPEEYRMFVPASTRRLLETAKKLKLSVRNPLAAPTWMSWTNMAGSPIGAAFVTMIGSAE